MAAGGHILVGLNVLRGVKECLPEESVFQLSLEDEMRVAEEEGRHRMCKVPVASRSTVQSMSETCMWLLR